MAASRISGAAVHSPPPPEPRIRAGDPEVSFGEPVSPPRVISNGDGRFDYSWRRGDDTGSEFRLILSTAHGKWRVPDLNQQVRMAGAD